MIPHYWWTPYSLTDPNNEGTLSGVVSLCSQCIAIAATELNDLKIVVGDISSAYLKVSKLIPKKKYISLSGLSLDHLKESNALFGLLAPAVSHSVA